MFARAKIAAFQYDLENGLRPRILAIEWRVQLAAWLRSLTDMLSWRAIYVSRPAHTCHVTEMRWMLASTCLLTMHHVCVWVFSLSLAEWSEHMAPPATATKVHDFIM
jgi:hypothetical protein